MVCRSNRSRREPNLVENECRCHRCRCAFPLPLRRLRFAVCLIILALIRLRNRSGSQYSHPTGVIFIWMERSFLDGGNENPDIPLRKEYFTSPSNSISLLEKYHIEIDKNLDVLSVDTD